MKATKHQSNPRRRRWSFAIGCIWVLAAILSVINAALLYERSSDGAVQAANSDGANIGRIEEQTSNVQCSLEDFDNKTGRIIDDSKHCEDTVTLDAHGIPVPEGTIHRLDSIRKSFSGDNP